MMGTFMGRTEVRADAGRQRALSFVVLAVLAFGASGCAHRSEPGVLQPYFQPQAPDRLWPVQQGEHRIISRYGAPRLSAGGDTYAHQGVDIPAPIGTPALATQSGTVAFSGQQRGYGQIVILNHTGNMASVYAHLNKRIVEAGQRVRQGEAIGQTGQSGKATGPHLHFEIRKNGEAVDPLRYLPGNITVR